jgi:asparagine synthase (glutamine-hydrolysing)
MDFATYLPEDILVKVDRASMGNSLEVRAPWLDWRLIEFAFGRVPSQLKATPSERKILPKMLARKILPPAFDMNRKQGFSIPLGDWLKQAPWLGYFQDILLGNESDFFERGEVEALFHGQRRGRANSERLFALTMFELWRREYRVSH